MSTGDLIKFVDVCQAFVLQSSRLPSQIPMWPETADIYPGEIGVLLSKAFYEDVGCLCEVLIGSIVFFDVPMNKIEKLPTPTV
jgi:hypothetical protein